MKETTRTSRTTGQLEKMFREINKDSFNGEIEEPIITIQSTKGAYGHVTVAKTWTSGKMIETHRHELNINGDFLYRPIENVCATLIHEMTHLYNIQKGVKDTSRGGAYHNQKFKDEAEKHMIQISHDEKYGWTITRPTEELLDYIIAKGWKDFAMTGNPLFSIFGDMGATGGAGEPKGKEGKGDTPTRKSSSRKGVCPSCGLIIRATKKCNVICGDCNVEINFED